MCLSRVKENQNLKVRLNVLQQRMGIVSYITLFELGFLNVFENIDLKTLVLLFFRHR